MNDDSAGVAIAFDNGPAYERFMGRWSRAAGAAFIDWLAPPKRARWLEIGCGTGAFTELVLNKCAPTSLIGVDPAIPQIEYCRRQSIANRVDFQVADAHALPFPSNSFDIIASALVLNFVADLPRALSEMHRLGCSGGLAANYVWDFASGGAPNSCITLALRQIGFEAPRLPGSGLSTAASLRASFERAGFEHVAAKSFEIRLTFPHFNDFWHSQTPSFSPTTRIIKELTNADRMRLKDFVRTQLIFGRDGTVSCSARANAIKARLP